MINEIRLQSAGKSAFYRSTSLRSVFYPHPINYVQMKTILTMWTS